MTGTDGSEESFLCDHMLGTLARWLRILGFDAAYPEPPLDDEVLAERARQEGRVLLTRDRDLDARTGVRTLYITSDVLEEQVREVLHELELRVTDALSLCPLCSARLEEVDKEAVEGRVPPGVYAQQETFWRCPSCGQHYWQGSHWERMTEQIEAYRRSAEDVSRSESRGS